MSKFLGMLCGECESFNFIKDSAPRVIRRVVVRDSANDDELVRYAKTHDDWEAYGRPRGKKEIRLSLDNSHYAAISVIEGKDAEYEVHFRGFSDAIDAENTRNYTDLERAARFAYARGKDLLEKGSVGDARRSRTVRDDAIVKRSEDPNYTYVRMWDNSEERVVDLLDAAASLFGTKLNNVTDESDTLYADVVYPQMGSPVSILFWTTLEDTPDYGWHGGFTFLYNGKAFGQCEFTSETLTALFSTTMGYASDADSAVDLIHDLLKAMPSACQIEEDVWKQVQGFVGDARGSKRVGMTRPQNAKGARRSRTVRDNRGRCVRVRHK